jgi:hypothetical protein
LLVETKTGGGTTDPRPLISFDLGIPLASQLAESSCARISTATRVGGPFAPLFLYSSATCVIPYSVNDIHPATGQPRACHEQKIYLLGGASDNSTASRAGQVYDTGMVSVYACVCLSF